VEALVRWRHMLGGGSSGTGHVEFNCHLESEDGVGRKATAKRAMMIKTTEGMLGRAPSPHIRWGKSQDQKRSDSGMGGEKNPEGDGRNLVVKRKRDRLS